MLHRIMSEKCFLILSELFFGMALLSPYFSYTISLASLMISTALYYVGMTELVRERLGKWAVRRFTIAYLLRAVSWLLMASSAYYTYSAVIKNILPFGPKEFVVTSVVALIGAGVNYIAVGVRNSVLWKIEGLKKSLWFSRINSIVLFLMAAVPFIPLLSTAEELKWLLGILSLPVFGSFTLLAILGKLFYWKFLISLEPRCFQASA
jgi:hypothetical protein